MNAMQALNRARDAWQRSQPQYVLDLYGDADEETDALEGGARSSSTDGGVTGAVLPLERVQPVVSHPSCNGLTPLEVGPQTGGALVIAIEGEDGVRPEAAPVLPTGGYV